MTEDRRRRSRAPEAPQSPTGYRQTRRSSSALKSAKRAERKHRVAMATTRAGRSAKNLLLVLLQGLAIAGIAVLALLVIATAVNTFSRWSAERQAKVADTPAVQTKRVRENVLYIGVDGGKAIGYLAMRVDGKRDEVFGVAISEGVFVDIPGMGFERIGAAYEDSPQTALMTISNFFTVPFEAYVAVPADAYRDALTAQRVSGLVGTSVSTNLAATELKTLEKRMSAVPQKNVALVPMPVKPLKLGKQTYFEPQRDEIADLLKQWWGIDPNQGEQTTRVIVYNGAGVPGIAGQAAQQLIRAGFRVIDTKNAETFDYKKTEITVKRGERVRGDKVREALGVGTVNVDISTADVTDVIVVIGKDYKPAPAEKGEQ